MDGTTQSVNEKRTRKSAHELPLCEGLSIRYTFSSITAVNRKRGNTANQIKLYLYSSFRKKTVGTGVRSRYTMPLKKVRKGTKQSHPPTAEVVLDGIQKLLVKNENLQLRDLIAKAAEIAVATASIYCKDALNELPISPEEILNGVIALI